MPRVASCEGLILQKTPYGDSDAIVHCLTNGGVETYFARSARRSARRFAGHLDYFRRLSLQVEKKREGAWAHLSACEAVEVWEPLWQDPDKYPLASRWIALLRRLLPAGKGASQYGFICESLRYLAAAPLSCDIPIRFELKLSERLGYGPDFEPCTDRTSRAWISAWQEGRLTPLDPATEKKLRIFLDRHWQEVGV